MPQGESGRLFGAKGRHPRSAETALDRALRLARADLTVLPVDGAAIGLARQAARAVDDALRADERADNVATLIRAHLAVLGTCGLTPAARLDRHAAEVDDLNGLLAGLDTPE